MAWFAAMDPSVLLDAAFYGRITRSSHAAAYTLMVYDWLLCFEDERKFVFTTKLSLAKVIYLLARYYPLATYPVSMWVQIQDHDRTLCDKIYNLPMFMVIPNQIFSEVILILRTYAFTGGNRPIFALLCASLATVGIYQAWVGATQAALIPFGNGCFPVDKGTAKHLSGYFLSTLLFDCLITLVFVIYAFRVISFKFGIANPITKLFIREGFGYFVCISAVNIANGVLNFQPNGAMATVNVPMSLVLPSVLACRLVLNLRHFADPDSHDIDSTRISFSQNRGGAESFEMTLPASHPAPGTMKSAYKSGRASAMLEQVMRNKQETDRRETLVRQNAPDEIYLLPPSLQNSYHMSNHDRSRTPSSVA